MPPQAIYTSTNDNSEKILATPALAIPVQNVLKGNKQQKTKITKSRIPSPIQKVSSNIWPWTTVNGGAGTGANFTGQRPSTASNNKRLKFAAMEESQTKITGYFKSQMKAQIPCSGHKKDNKFSNALPSLSLKSSLSPSGTVTSTTSSSICTVPLVKTTTSSLDKYFSLLNSQMPKEEMRTTNLPLRPQALKKIDCIKPTKIAQVAPNIRQASTTLPLANLTGKSPKKHVKIAPRTAEAGRSHLKSVLSPLKTPTTPPLDQQPSVLFTAINVPQSNQPPQLVPTSSSLSSKISTGSPLYQIPMISNLVQFPNLIATNVSQISTPGHHAATAAQYFLNGTVFKLQPYTLSTGATSAAFSTDNGKESTNKSSVAIATDIEHSPSIDNNVSSITATSLREMFSNQSQQHQQSASVLSHRLHQPRPLFMEKTGLLVNATSLPPMLAGIGAQQIPALQPIQSALTPGLSSIFNPIREKQMQQYKLEHVASSLEQQFSTLQQPTNVPPLSLSSSAFSKLSLVSNGSANFTSSVHQVSATQPPPLVTISTGSPIASCCCTKNETSKKQIQPNSEKQENVSKVRRTAKDGAPPFILPATLKTAHSKSPPALVYPSLLAKKEQHRNEELFDVLKNSTNEIALTSTAFMQYQSNKEKNQRERDKEEELPLLGRENKPRISITGESTKDLVLCVQATSIIKAEIPSLENSQKTNHSETEAKTAETSSSDACLITATVEVLIADNNTLPKCAISPILSQPKTIRFPVKHASRHHFGPKGMRRHDGVCHWNKCNIKHESSSKLLDHMQTNHVNPQSGPFACLWLGCKVYGRESCSRRWLERHVLSHGGTKPFKCIVDGCGLRFGSQLALQKHVNGHFTATESKDSTSRRASDPPVPKLLRKNGKKLRYRRQPFSARMFDFFDAGIMEGLHHRLRQLSTLTNGRNCITFRGKIMMRRKNINGIECFVVWAPPNIISNEWLPASNMPYIKSLSINRLQANEKTNVESLLKSAYRLPHSPNLFQSYHSLTRQNSQDSTQDSSQSSLLSTEDEASLSSTFGHSISSLCGVSNLPLKFPQMEVRKKQSRKQPKRKQSS